jgi:RNA-directed DNA polymerase
MESNHNRAEADGMDNKKRKDMTDAERVQLLQRKLYLKAKQEREYKFYVLYDKLFLVHILRESWKRVKRNDGKGGIDKQSIEDIEAKGIEEFLHEISEELRTQTYNPNAVLRAWIEKDNGSKRPLGIPIIKDRVVQMACKLVIEPIFEADFEDSSYGFRPNRSAQDAIKAVKEQLQEGSTEVYDADLSSYFDTIPHAKLMILLRQRITDPRVLKLIYKWLKVPVYEDGEFKGGKKSKEGTPQGGVISPLLANIYLNLLDKIINKSTSLYRRIGVKIIRYADDFVLMGGKLTEEVITRIKGILKRMGLTLNEQKTRHIQAKETPFNFLGFTFRYDKDIFGRQNRYWNVISSKKSMNNTRKKISDFLDHAGHFPPQAVSKGLNEIIRGTVNYFDIPGISYAAIMKRGLRHYLNNKLYKYYNRKSQRKSSMYRQHAFDILVSKYGLIDPTKYSRVNKL